MPLTMFKCPDGKTRTTKGCLERCPRLEGRCLSLPALHDIGWQREWTGEASTTMLLNPTRLEYLKLTCDYAIDPTDRAFALLGTRHHKRLELVAQKIEGLIAEKKLDSDDVQKHSGILDLLEPDELQEGYYKLIDHKSWGSYAVAKILGRGNNGEYERTQAALQLNDYRLKAEKLSFKISRLMIQATVRDGGTFIAKKNNVPEKMLMIPIERLDDEFVVSYFSDKNKALMDALKNKELPPMCDYEGRWANRRCKGYCDVASFCPEGRAMNKMPKGEPYGTDFHNS